MDELINIIHQINRKLGPDKELPLATKPDADRPFPLQPCACCHRLYENTELRLWENKLICRSCEKFIKK